MGPDGGYLWHAWDCATMYRHELGEAERSNRTTDRYQLVLDAEASLVHSALWLTMWAACSWGTDEDGYR